jgi:hypothetical protein
MHHSSMDKGIQFSPIWSDIDVLKLRVAAWNGKFGGATDIYAGIGGLAEAATKIEGFPRHPSDVREIQFGEFGPQWADGAIKMRFYCEDAAGHAVVEARIESDHRETHTPQSALLLMSIEAAAVDIFVADLRLLETNLCGAALLRGSGPA